MLRRTPWWIRGLAAFILFLMMLWGTLRYSLTQIGLHFLAKPSAAESCLTLNGARKLRLTTPDHCRISALYFPPVAAKAPAVILCHGCGQTLRSTLSIASWLHQAGFAVLTFDYRGFGQSSGSLRSFRDLAVDLRTALTFIKNRPEVDSRRLGLLGLSLGTAPVIRTAAEERDVKALLLHGAFYSGERWVTLMFPDPAPAFCARYLLNLEGLDNARFLRGVHCPLLMIQEEHDKFTTTGEALRLFRLAPGPKSFWLVPGEGHLEAILHQPEKYRRKVVGFFRRMLGLKSKSVKPG